MNVCEHMYLKCNEEDIQILNSLFCNNLNNDVDNKNREKSYKGVIVKKPWGFEFACVERPNEFNIWCLYMNKDESTSLHCHQNKETILCVVSGKVKISTVHKKDTEEDTEEEFTLNQFDFIRIGAKAFHQITCLEENTILLEIEMGKKEDLVRYKDKYNRQNTKYEGKDKFINSEGKEYYFNFGDSTGVHIFKNENVTLSINRDKKGLEFYPGVYIDLKQNLN